MDSNPLVSIIIPAYNAEKYIQRALESALAQTYKDIEIIVIDDGSTDKTAEIIKTYQDPRIIYIFQKNQGQGPARNNGIKKSQGEYITFLDADDYYFPEKVEKQVRFLENHPEYQAVYCNALHFYSDNPTVIFKKKGNFHSGDIFKDLLESSYINPNTIMIYRKVLDKAGLFNENRYYPEDWELWLRISRTGFRFGYLDEDLVKVEIRPDSNTTMAIQWILKNNALKMFENIFSSMSPEERFLYKTEEILRKMRFKLAVAYLVGGRKKDFFKTFAGLYQYPFKIFAYLTAGLLIIIPSVLLRSVLIKLWKINQLRHSTPSCYH